MARRVITVEVIYEPGDIYNMTREEQKALIRANITSRDYAKAVAQLFPWDYLLARTDVLLSFDPLEDL
jgi:hypothetical protein